MRAQMPKMVYGTAWKHEKTADLVLEAIGVGFRGIDTACQPKHYNERGVGDALRVALNCREDGGLGLKREELFLQTKFTSVDGQDPDNIPYNMESSLQDQVKQSFNKSLENLGVKYIDSLLLHAPLESHDKNMEVWRTFEGLVDEGKVCQLGVSNFYFCPQLEALYQDAHIKPKVLQNRFHERTKYDKTVRRFCNERGMKYQSFWTLTANLHILNNAKIVGIAERRGNTPAQLFFAFLIQSGIVPLVGCTSKIHMTEDMRAINLKLTPEEFEAFDALIS